MRITPIVLVLAALGLAACDDTNNNGVVSPNVLAGSFILQSVSGNQLPAVVVDSANPAVRLDALSGVISINGGDQFVDATTFRQTVSGVISTRTVTCPGTYTVAGTVFQFVEATPAPDCGRTFTGVIEGTTLNASVLGIPAIFVMAVN